MLEVNDAQHWLMFKYSPTDGNREEFAGIVIILWMR